MLHPSSFQERIQSNEADRHRRFCGLPRLYRRPRADGISDPGCDSDPCRDRSCRARAAATPSAKEARAQCKADAKAQGLKGDARKAAVEDCFAKARPDIAAAKKCREEGKAKGLADKELKAYVKTCKADAAQ